MSSVWFRMLLILWDLVWFRFLCLRKIWVLFVCFVKCGILVIVEGCFVYDDSR